MLFSDFSHVLLRIIMICGPLFVYLNPVYCLSNPLSLSRTLQYVYNTSNGPRDRSHVLNPGSDDTYVLSEGLNNTSIIKRDLSPDILATGAPFPVSPQTSKNVQPDGNSLILRSSSKKVTVIGDLTIYAFPIIKDELMTLLDATHSDLQNHNPYETTSYYQYNTTKWSFSIVALNNTLPYSAIQAVVLRYIKLAPITTIPTFPNMIWARAGALFRANISIAGIIIIPLLTNDSTNISTSTITNTTTYYNISNTEPTELYTITPQGSTCSYQIIDQFAALNPFSNIAHPKRSDFDAQVFARAAQTIWGVSIRLWRDPEGIPARINRAAAYAVLAIAMDRMVFAELRAHDLDLDFRGAFQVEIDMFNVSLMQTKLMMLMITPDAQGRVFVLQASYWRGLIALLLDPLDAMKDLKDVWALEGEILETSTAVGRWYLRALSVDNSN